MVPKIFKKTITCADGAAVTNVDMGFVPDWVIVRNRNVADTEILEWQWGKSMDDATGWKTIKHATNGDMTTWAASGGDISKLDTKTIQTTNPVTVLHQKGIIIAAAFHDTSDVIDIVAFRSDVGD